MLYIKVNVNFTQTRGPGIKYFICRMDIAYVKQNPI